MLTAPNQPQPQHKRQFPYPFYLSFPFWWFILTIVKVSIVIVLGHARWPFVIKQLVSWSLWPIGMFVPSLIGVVSPGFLNNAGSRGPITLALLVLFLLFSDRIAYVWKIESPTKKGFFNLAVLLLLTLLVASVFWWGQGRISADFILYGDRHSPIPAVAALSE